MRAVTLGAVICLSTLSAVSTTASAQPGMTDPEPIPAPASHEELSENTALALSVGGTIASWTMVLAASGMEQQGDGANAIGIIGGFGVWFAPSFGHWYAHSYATRGLGLRGLGGAAALAGLVVAFSECPLFSTEEECHESKVAPVLVIAGIGLFVGGTIDDIATAPRAARRYNHRFDNVSIVPVVKHDSGGVAVMGRF